MNHQPSADLMLGGLATTTKTNERIYSRTAFRRVLQRERCRADRNSHGFSFAVFSVAPGDAKQGLEKVAGALASRIRFTDEIGWVNRRELGVMLPDTYEEGVSLFADNILRVLTLDGVPTNCRVYTYTGGHQPGLHPAAPCQLWFPEIAAMKVGDRESPAVTVCGESIESFLAEPHPVSKRILDVCGASLALLVLSPVLLLIALLVKLVSRGPVFYRQERVGYMGKPFQCLKFRTMHTGANVASHEQHLKGLIRSNAPLTKLDHKNDSRIIPFGRLLRAAGLDELPQLINVLRGEMSLIGPRPCIPYEYSEFQNWQRRRVSTAPGLTGLWQVSGKNRTTFQEMMRLDIAYFQRRSLRLDLVILVRTIPAVLQQVRDMLRRTGANQPASAL